MIDFNLNAVLFLIKTWFLCFSLGYHFREEEGIFGKRALLLVYFVISTLFTHFKHQPLRSEALY